MGETSPDTFPTIAPSQICRPSLKDSLTGDQAQLFILFEQKIQTDPDISEQMKYQDNNFKVDRSCLFRYLTANRWDFTAAITGILNTIEWRKETGIGNMYITEDIKAQGVTPKIVNHGFSKFGHPVLYFVPRFEILDEDGLQYQYVMFNIELAIKRMPEGIHQLLLIIDLSGIGRDRRPSIEQAKKIIKTLVDHYPDRLYRAYMLNAPWYYQPIWRIISMFIDPLTKSKMVFVKSGDRRTRVDSGLELGSVATPWHSMLSNLREVDFLHEFISGNPDTGPFKFDSETYFQSIQEFLACAKEE